MPSIWLSRGSLLILIDETFEVVQGKVHRMDVFLRQRFFIYTFIFYKKKGNGSEVYFLLHDQEQNFGRLLYFSHAVFYSVLILRSSEDLKDSSTF